jgi:hypothetical protein
MATFLFKSPITHRQINSVCYVFKSNLVRPGWRLNMPVRIRAVVAEVTKTHGVPLALHRHGLCTAQ